MSASSVPILQIAYIVRSIAEAADKWNSTLGVGPFFVGDSTIIGDARYRGEESRATFNYAMGYSGDMQIELIEQTNDAPSVFQEVLQARGEGYHHFLPMVPDYDQSIVQYAKAGADVAFTGRITGGGRVAYVDGRKDFGGFIEIVDITPGFLKGKERFKAACQKPWDGKDLIRPFSMLR